MANMRQLDPKPTNHCFGCGGSNPSGMQLAFTLDLDAGHSHGSFTLGPNYAGGGGFAHGGIIAVILDEAMGKISRLKDESAVTADMHIEYKRPVPIGKPIVVEGWQEEEKGRNRFRVAEIRDPEGNLLARGKGRFVIVAQAHFTEAQPAQS